VEDDVDVDGDDDDVFGHAQFTEVDILSGAFSQPEEPSVKEEVDIEEAEFNGTQAETSRDPIVDGKGLNQVPSSKVPIQ